MDQNDHVTSTNGQNRVPPSVGASDADALPDSVGAPRNHSDDDAKLDESAWSAICESVCRDDFQSYLRQFKTGAHRVEAIEKVVALNDSPVAGEPLYQRALSLFMDEANLGNAAAQFHLGKALTEGIGVAADREAGERWYQLAIRQGETRACVNVSMAILDAPQEHKANQVDMALQYAKEAAANGDPMGLSILATEKLRGRVTETDVPGAIELLESALDRGLGWAGVLLARIFMHDELVTPNPEFAEACARRAVVLSCGDAAHFLGVRAERAATDVATMAIAREWYEMGAELRDPSSMRQLGLLLLRGRHVTRDGAMGVAWLKRAAALGDITAIRDLGITYFHGVDVVKNGAEAFKWFERAFAGGDKYSAEYLGACFDQGIGTAANHEAAIRHYGIAAREGSASAQCSLGIALLTAEPSLRDKEQAARWLHLACLQKDARAMAALGKMLETGDGVPTDVERAIELYRASADAEDAVGQASLGACYLAGVGVPFDPAWAAHWLDRATRNGSDRAPYLLGAMFARGLGVERNPSEARSWFRLAAERGNAGAQLELGCLLAEEAAGECDLADAEKWLSAALASGLDDARAPLDKLRGRRKEVISPQGDPSRNQKGAVIHPIRDGNRGELARKE
jgi:TPR repeat protein